MRISAEQHPNAYIVYRLVVIAAEEIAKAEPAGSHVSTLKICRVLKFGKNTGFCIYMCAIETTVILRAFGVRLAGYFGHTFSPSVLIFYSTSLGLVLLYTFALSAIC